MTITFKNKKENEDSLLLSYQYIKFFFPEFILFLLYNFILIELVQVMR